MSTKPGWPAYQCPTHGVPLESSAEAMLTCPAGEQFPIIDAIPRFVPDEDYATSFGAQWNRYPRTQLDSHNKLTLSYDRLRRCLGEEVWSRLSGAQVLECGCGAGRFTEVLLAQGASVTSIDLSSAVEANRANFDGNDRHRVAQADLHRPPFAPRSFDLVVCLGVVQHTPDPQRTIACLFDQVATGGWLVVDHYARSRLSFLSVKAAARHVLKNRAPEKNFRTVERLVGIFLPLHKRTAHVPLVRSVVGRLSPVIHYYGTYPRFTDAMQREWALLDTHDALTDHFKHLCTTGEMERMLKAAGALVERCEPEGNGIEARARRPSTSA